MNCIGTYNAEYVLMGKKSSILHISKCTVRYILCPILFLLFLNTMWEVKYREVTSCIRWINRDEWYQLWRLFVFNEPLFFRHDIKYEETIYLRCKSRSKDKLCSLLTVVINLQSSFIENYNQGITKALKENLFPH